MTCGKRLATGQWWNFCGETDMGQTMPVQCTECGGEYPLAQPEMRPVATEPAPPNSLPSWSECALRVGNSDFIAKRVAEGGYGAEGDSILANALHRFIYEYDDADPYRSAWFLHRLEQVITECASPPQRQWVGLTDEDKDEIIRVTESDHYHDILMLTEAKLKEKNT